jgi:hypothetical protein
MRITDTGKVGIGTTSPTALLHLPAGTASANTAPLKFTSGTNLTTTEAGVLEFDGTRWFATPVTTRRAVALSSDHITASTSVTNTTTETTVFTGTIAANEMAVGKTFRARIMGRFSTANATDVFTLRPKVNGVTAGVLNSNAALRTNAPFYAEFTFTVRTTGSAPGTLGTYWTFASGVIDSSPENATGTAAGSVDTGLAANVTFTVTWTAANAGNTVSIDQAYLEMLN